MLHYPNKKQNKTKQKRKKPNIFIMHIEREYLLVQKLIQSIVTNRKWINYPINKND